MTLPLEEVIRLYLGGRIELPLIWDWLATCQWDLHGDDKLLANEVEDAVIYHNDGYLDEQDVRLWLSTLLERRTIHTERVSIRFGPAKLVYPYRLSAKSASAVQDIAVSDPV